MIPLGNTGGGGGKELPLDTVNNQGVVYWLGTNKGTSTYTNAHNLGVVTCSWIGNGTGVPADTVNRNVSGENVHTTSTTNSWWKIDIGTSNTNRRLQPTYMRCKNRSLTDQTPINGIVQGSNDDTNWTTVGGFTSGVFSAAADSWTTLQLSPTLGAFRYFKLQLTSTNTNATWYLCIAEYELFGLLSE
jgi:hypothetical protein